MKFRDASRTSTLGDMKHILFICSRNKLRSPTAEDVFCTRNDWSVRSAGLTQDAEVHVSQEDLEWADIVFVMEGVHKNRLKQQFPTALKNCRIVCLGIPDQYEYMDPRLVTLLKRKVPSVV
jgi:predicted protein tyrosine phosphatase